MFIFIPRLLSVLLPSSPRLNFNQMARFARELGISKMPGLEYPRYQDCEYPEYQIPRSVMKKEKKTNPTSQEESKFSNDTRWRHECKLNHHKPLENPRRSLPWPCGSLFSHRATMLWFFQTGKIMINFEKILTWWLSNGLNQSFFWSPRSWGLHCKPKQLVDCCVLLRPPRDMEPPSPPEDSPRGSTFPSAMMHNIFF